LTWGGSGGGITIDLDSRADRAVTVFVLLAGALGIVRLHGLWDLARREGRPRLRRAALGPLLGSLGLFLLAAQALLYGRTALHILSLASLIFVPAGVLLLPIFRAGEEEAALPARARRSVSSLILIGLGAFLVSLAVLGQVIHRYLPEQELVWFYWGGAILLLVFASLWLIPSLREALIRWFGPGQGLHADPRWEWARVNQALVPVESPAQLTAKLGPLLQDLIGRSAVVLWLAEPSGERFAPVASEGRSYPALERNNPLLTALREGNGVLNLGKPPSRLAQLPPFVENQELVDRLGFRLFVALRAGGEELGLLGLSPKSKHLGPESFGLLENLGAQLSNVVWGMTLAERLARTREGESFHRLGSFVLHDLKNAVGVLRGVVSNAGLHMGDARFRQDLVSTLEATVSRMEGTLERLRAGMLGEPEPRPVELATAFDRLGRQLSPLAEAKGVRLSVEARVTRPILTDPERLETILHNLLRNAIEASPGGGVVSLHTAAANGAAGEGEEETLSIVVTDQGRAADLSRVRQAFRRPLASEKPEGWGIGLYQSSLLAESLRGRLSAEPAGAEGVRVTLTLPAGARPAGEAKL